MLSIFDLLHELIWKVIPEIICMIPFHVPAFAQILSLLACDILLSQGTGLYLFFPYFYRKEGLLQFQGLSVGKVTSQLAQPGLFIWNWLGQNVAIRKREFHIEMFSGVGERRQSLPSNSEMLTLLLFLLLTVLLFWGLDWKAWNLWHCHFMLLIWDNVSEHSLLGNADIAGVEEGRGCTK